MATIHARFHHVLAGAVAFLALQYGLAILSLTHTSGAMANKFNALARDEYLGFLVLQNLQMLMAYVILAIAATTITQPAISLWTRHSKHHSPLAVGARAFAITALIHGYFKLRLADTRPYFLTEAEFGHWYYKALDFIPLAIKPASLFLLFTALPIALITLAIFWQIHRHGRRGWALAVISGAIITATAAFKFTPTPPTTTRPHHTPSPNVIIIGSDSLRGDRIGAAGYRPSRTDGPAADGVSPNIDAFAARSIRFENCYTSIASTIESGTQLMTSQYPQTHGIRQMYPERKTVEATIAKTVPIASILRKLGYDTATIGDWCSAYHEVIPLGFEHISVSSFDNFKIYMSQAVVMAHFVIPLYFDNPLGYILFPKLGAFAQFVTPDVVTSRVEKRLAQVAKDKKPFFWHVFYSCNHLPYRSPEPYNSMFADPLYQGANRHGVNFDIDSFIGGTDLESKWKALPLKEVEQIRALYDGCTRQFDDCVGRILTAIKSNGLAENTIVIVTSDHGDDLYEPGVTLGHGLTFNGGLQGNHVPMIIHVPGVAPRVIPETIRLIDLVPTIADLIGADKSPTWQGQSFAAWIRNTETPIHRPFYGETGFPFIQFTVPGVERPQLPPMDELTRIDKNYNYQFVLKPEYENALIQAKQRCLKTRNWKLVCTPTAQGGRHFGLFNMAADPHAQTDVASARPEVLAPMRTALELWMDKEIESSIAEIFPSGEPE